MTRFKNYTPQGVIPATLLAFNDDFSINEQESLRHLNFVAATQGVSAITINGHASEIHACSFDEQQRLLDVSAAAVGDRLPLINGVYADGSHEAAKIARMAEHGGASCLLIFPPHSFGMGAMQRRPEMALAHFKMIADATSLPLIAFQYPDELGYPLDTLVRMAEEIPSLVAIKDWSPAQRHERNIKTLHGLTRPLKVLSTNSSWLMASLTMGCDGLLSGAGSVIADLQAALFQAVSSGDLPRAQTLNERIWRMSEVFYADPFGDMHNRMKEALVLLGRLDKAVVRPPLFKLTQAEISRIAAALNAAGIERDGAGGLVNRPMPAE